MRHLLAAFVFLISYISYGQDFNPGNYKYLIIHYDNEVFKDYDIQFEEKVIIPDVLFGDGLSFISKSIPNKYGLSSPPKRKVFSNLLVKDIERIGDEKPVLIASVDWIIKTCVSCLSGYKFVINIDFYDALDINKPLHSESVETPLPGEYGAKNWNNSFRKTWKEIAKKVRYILGSNRYFDANSSVYYYAEIDQMGKDFYNDFITMNNGYETYSSDNFISKIDSIGISNQLEGIWKGFERVSNNYCPTERIGIFKNEISNRQYSAIILDSPTNNTRAEIENTARENVYSAVWRSAIDPTQKFEAWAEIIKNGSELKILFEDQEYQKGECIYIKIYPEVQREVIQNDNIGSGSCVLVNEKCGWFITNHHVVEGSSRLTIEINNEEKEAKIISSDESNDLALVKVIEMNENLLPKPFKISKKINMGMKINALGYPKISSMGGDIKITEGIVSGLTFLKSSTMFQLDASITNGNSGGAVVNEFFELVGISAAGWRPDENTENVNGAVKSNVVSMLLETMSYTCDDYNQDNEFVNDIEDAKKSVMIIRSYYD